MEKETMGRNQSYARLVNNKLVIQKLRERDCSATDLADELNLSPAALSSILKGLVASGIIKVSNSLSKSGKGRKQVLYSINEEYGYIIVVSLSANRYIITLSNLKEVILLEREKEIEHYDKAMLFEIILEIKSMLETLENVSIPLKKIIISLPGRVNEKTGELQLSKQFDKDLFSQKDYIIDSFAKYFNCEVSCENDINLSIIGETKLGCLQEETNAMLVYIDNGLGGAFLLNGGFFNGNQGYAGEIGLMRTYFQGRMDYLDEFVSLRSIRNYLEEKIGKKLQVNDVIHLFETDEEVHHYILQTAHLIGEKLRDIAELLDINVFVISGRVTLMKEEYLNAVKEEVEKARKNCTIRYSSLEKKATLIGAISKSVDHTLKLNDEAFSNEIALEEEKI